MSSWSWPAPARGHRVDFPFAVRARLADAPALRADGAVQKEMVTQCAMAGPGRTYGFGPVGLKPVRQREPRFE